MKSRTERFYTLPNITRPTRGKRAEISTVTQTVDVGTLQCVEFERIRGQIHFTANSAAVIEASLQEVGGARLGLYLFRHSDANLEPDPYYVGGGRWYTSSRLLTVIQDWLNGGPGSQGAEFRRRIRDMVTNNKLVRLDMREAEAMATLNSVLASRAEVVETYEQECGIVRCAVCGVDENVRAVSAAVGLLLTKHYYCTRCVRTGGVR